MKQYEYARFKMQVECKKGETPDLEKIELVWLNKLGKLGWQLSMMSWDTIMSADRGQLFVREVEPAISITNEEIKVGGTS